MITAIIYFQIILHPVVHIYDFHMFITLGYFLLIILPQSSSKGELMPKAPYFFSLFGLKFMLLV